MKKQNNTGHGWVKQINALLPMINVLHGFPRSKNVDKFSKLVNDLIINKGEEYTIGRLKAFRLVIQQFVLKQKLDPVPFAKTKRSGIPRDINFLVPDRDNVHSIRYSFTVLRIIESFRCKPEYKISTIIDPSSADKAVIEEIKEYIKQWSGIKLLPRLEQSKLVMSNRAGPNGPATISSMKDLAALRYDTPELYQAIYDMMKITVRGLDMNRYKVERQEGCKHSKLVLLSDKACKTRVIAIADWWSNTALESVHTAFMKALERLPTDVTYRQSEIPHLVKRLGSDLFSSDMTAFTDRFPIELEEAVVEAAYGTQISRLWKQIISNRNFSHPKGDVRYAVGNPMGILSSWPVSTLTHHCVKQWCAYKLNIHNYKYLILGDDTLDSRKDVYDLYTQTIKQLGVSISLSKCTQSNSANAEFAKRLFLNHVEVTGLPVHLLEEILQYPEQILEFVRICRERGYHDEILAPSLDLLLSNHSHGKMARDILSLPEVFSGMPPLLEVKPDSWASKIAQIPEAEQESMLRVARDYVFWTTVIGVNKSYAPKKVYDGVIQENHPIVAALSEQLMSYLPETDDDFSIYNEWVKGNYRHMANVPCIDTYRYYNKGHYATKCKYDVLKALLELANGNCNITLYDHKVYSNYDLFSMGFPTNQR
jgi:hypothetical protein